MLKRLQLRTTIFISIAILVSLWGISIIRGTYDSYASYKFYQIIGESSGNVLDLRKFNSIDWDEIDLIKPYEDICTKGIAGFAPNSDSCFQSTDDGESYLLFLKDNQLSHKVKLHRLRLDLPLSNLRWRIEKEKAVFKFITSPPYPKVQILE